MESSERDEWIRLMVELASLDREEFRRLRAAAWAAVVRGHESKTPDEIATWSSNAS